MDYLEFIKEVKIRAQIATQDEAEDAACATLDVLGQRLTSKKASNLAAQLPEQMTECLKQVPNAEEFGISEFYSRVAEREGVDVNVAAEHARAVAYVLKEAIDRTEFEEIISVLPYEYDELFGVHRVERTGISARE